MALPAGRPSKIVEHARTLDNIVVERPWRAVKCEDRNLTGDARLPDFWHA